MKYDDISIVTSTLASSPDFEVSDENEKMIETSNQFTKDEIEAFLKMEENLLNWANDIQKSFGRREKQKFWFKNIFFTLIMLLFAALVGTPIYVISKYPHLITTNSIIFIIVSSLLELISAILVLPRIIAEYLFSKSEEKSSTEMLNSIKEYHENRVKYFEHLFKKFN